MTRKAWAARVRANCESAGTYKPCFDDAIDTLAGILERRDKTARLAKDMIDDNGRVASAVKLLNELDRDALAYWRDLGLTPSGLKKINEAALTKREPTDPLAAALHKLTVLEGRG